MKTGNQSLVKARQDYEIVALGPKRYLGPFKAYAAKDRAPVSPKTTAK